MSSSLQRELELAQHSAIEAGKIILGYYDTDYQVQLKAGREPVTIADQTSSNYIIQAIQHKFPRDAIVSEESALPAGLAREDRIWVIDPMDGTKEFINHNGEFSVMIGLVREGNPVLGVVYQPVSGLMCWGVNGEGAYMVQGQTRKRLQVSTESALENLCVAASRSHLTPELEHIYHQLGFHHIIQSGSLGLKVALIARQLSHIYLNLSNLTSAWDTCAPEVILKEAGGRISNLFGSRLTYTFSHVRNRKGVLATNGPVHDYMVEQIQMLLTQRAQEELSV
ncbi:MAG: 3'(2'),5'-bisphosphate nucleotidase CysQ [Candidatus Melainabacteria bacterium HGW-Melainabacteria-1]|nr:MAG: 3'(2'),5'-bisphosphate nucleotidase CysQ [Candidatus Melainabacteria bacterium HGW-Melainabacteria-1]